ncbi:MAG: restriction endonuclease subunit S [Clostridium fessum]
MKKPKIRFKGYQEDWEQRKFADFTWDAGKRNKEDLDLEPYAITNEHGFIRQRDAHDDFGYMKDTDRKAYNIVQPNSFAYNPARINVGSIGYYKGVENVIVSSLYEVFQTDNYVNDRFLWHWLKSDEFPRWIEKLQEGSVRLYFYYDKLCECQLYMPSLEEQEKIASFLDDLDNLITLHQRKCEETKTLKKYMLQKMFPQNGHSVPEIRFSGFTEDWEQRKLSELGQIMTGSTPSTSKSEYYSEDGIPWVTPTDIEATTILDTPRKLSEEGAKVGRVVPANTILCTCIASIGKNTLLMVKGSFNQQINSLTPYEENDAYFLLTESELWSNKMKRMAASGTMQIVNKTEFSELQTMVPKSAEQKQIGSYFRNLDHLITLHQHKCEELQNIKKFMLKNMFI